MWVIDEYAIIVRKWDWFIPISPPSSALIIATVIIKVEHELFRINAKITNGASFCHVARIIHDVQDRDVITEGNQKWNGAIPSFSRIAAVSNIFMCAKDTVHCDNLVISINLDPSAWAMKYLMDASVSWLDFEWDISGINLSILISIAIHKKSQFVLASAIMVLISKVNSAIK